MTAAPQGAEARRRIGGLDSVRAVSILLVLVDHGAEAYAQSWVGVLFLSIGGLGVETFFVLSGFLITMLLLAELERSGRIDYLAFYRRRIARLMPAFVLYLLIGVAVLTWRHKPVPWEAMLAGLLYVVNYYQAFTGAPTHWVSHCWSLAVEEQFYFIWPLAAGALAARRIGFARALAAAIVAVWVLRAALALAGVPEVYLYRALETRADQLLAGCLLAVLVREPRIQQRLVSLWRLPGLALALALAVWLSTMAGHYGSYRYTVGYVIEPIFIALLIHWAVQRSAGPGIAGRALRNPALVHIGRVSYGIYLFHGMLMLSVVRPVHAWTGSFVLALVLAIGVVIAFSTLSFRFFETPMRRWIAGPARA